MSTVTRGLYTTKEDGTRSYDWWTILNQGEVWVDAKGRIKSINRLDSGYLRNILRFIERLAERPLFELAMLVSEPYCYDGEDDILDEPDYGIEWIRSRALHRSISARLELRELRASADQRYFMEWLS